MGEGISVKKIKQLIGYQNHMPRCATCIHFKPSSTRLMNSLPVKIDSLCKLHQINVKVDAVCFKDYTVIDSNMHKPKADVISGIKKFHEEV